MCEWPYGNGQLSFSLVSVELMEWAINIVAMVQDWKQDLAQNMDSFLSKLF